MYMRVKRDRVAGVEGAIQSGMGREKEIYGRGRGEGSMSLHKYIHSRDGYEYLLRRKKAMLSA